MTRRIVGPVKTVTDWNWTTHPLRTTAEQEAMKALRKGTLLHPHGQDVALGPTSIRPKDRESDPMARLRALAAWADFRDAYR